VKGGPLSVSSMSSRAPKSLVYVVGVAMLLGTETNKWRLATGILSEGSFGEFPVLRRQAVRIPLLFVIK